MDYIIELYKNLDSINLLLFWGVIIVIILLLVFSIIMINKNRTLKNIIAEQSKNVGSTSSDIPIKQVNDTRSETKETILSQETMPNIKENTKQDITKPIKEKNFIAEEYVIDFEKNKTNSPDNIKTETTKTITKPVVKEVIVEHQKPYQKNILKELAYSQTSPIGIVKQESNHEQEYIKAEELHNSLDKNTYKGETIKTTLNETIDNRGSFNEVANDNSQNKKNLNEVSNKLIEAMPEITRTEYDIKQEEDAIISYDELMRKKDTIKTIDEEEAIISIEELYRKEKEKTYGITETEKDKEFIDELKNFRNDL